MISILIVEDSTYKSDKVVKLLTEDLMLVRDSIDIASDIKAAKRLIICKTYDLLILDLVLPLEKDDLPSAEKGIGFLKDLETNPSLHPPIHVIGLTEFSDLQKEYEVQFSNYLWHLINYNATEINWQDKLKNYVYHLISTRERFLESIGHNAHKSDVVVMTALNKPEFEKILEWPADWQELRLPDDPTLYYQCTLSSAQNQITVTAACVGEMGMTATAVLATKVIHQFSPKTIIMGGICAGLKERGLNYGDIIIADQSWDYGSGKMKDSDDNDSGIVEIMFEPDPRPIQLTASLKAKANAFLRRKDILSQIQNDCKYAKPKILLNALIGPVASGSYVISTKAKLEEIRATQRKLLGVEMEGYGLYYACEHNQDKSVKGIMIKSVSDFGDSTKNDQFQEYSSYTSAQFIFHFICEELIYDR